jgi:hypothetical protein
MIDEIGSFRPFKRQAGVQLPSAQHPAEMFDKNSWRMKSGRS